VPSWLPTATVSLMEWNSKTALQDACIGVDVVIHAAGINSANCAKDPVTALLVNGVATTRFVESASKAGVSKFIYLSTAHVYSNPLNGEIDERSCTFNSHPYASSHLAGENAVLHEFSRSSLVGSVLRLSNGFGPPTSSDVDCWTLLVNGLCRQVVTTGRLTLQSTGEQFRDFVPISFITKKLIYLIELETKNIPPILNIGSGNCFSVSEMAHLIQDRCTEILKITPTIEFGKKREPIERLKYGSIYKNNIKISPENIAHEIDELLIYCINNFKNDN
jgi:UDP-glucose 4-epimerase